MRGTILEVRAAEPRKAAAILREKSAGGRTSVGLFGDRVHVVSSGPEQTSCGGGVGSWRPPDCRRSKSVRSRRRWKTCLSRCWGMRSGEAGTRSEACNGDSIAFSAAATPDKVAATDPRTSAASDQAVVVENLEKRFGSFVAVNRVSFQVGRGEIFGFLGPNGAGKSTTIRMLCGILAPTAGAAPVAGFDVRTQSEQIKANIGYMSQKFSLYQDLTVEENIDFYSGIYRIPAAARRRLRKQWVIDMAGPGRTSPSPHGDPLRRLEAAAGPGLRHPAPAADRVSRRAHLRRRSGQPPPVLGLDLRDGRRAA